MRHLLVIPLWGAFVAAGALNICSRQASSQVCALQLRRTLPENYRLEAADVAAASPSCTTAWQGKYLAASAPAELPILASQLRSQPVIGETPQRAAVLSDTGGMPLNAGWRVDVYRDGQLIAADARVLAVLCTEGKCSSVVLSVPSSDLKKLAESKGPSVYVLRSQG